MAIYFIHVPEPYPDVLDLLPLDSTHYGLIKIGYTKRYVFERIVEVRRYADDNIGKAIEIGEVFGDMDDENLWHYTFKELRVKKLGEWFILKDNLLESVLNALQRNSYDRVRDLAGRSIANYMNRDMDVYQKLYRIAEHIHHSNPYRAGDPLYRMGEDDVFIGDSFYKAFELAVNVTFEEIIANEE